MAGVDYYFFKGLHNLDIAEPGSKVDCRNGHSYNRCTSSFSHLHQHYFNLFYTPVIVIIMIFGTTVQSQSTSLI